MTDQQAREMTAHITAAVERREMSPEGGQALALSIAADVAAAEEIARTALSPAQTSVAPIQDSGLSPVTLAVNVLMRPPHSMSELDAHRKLAAEGVDAHAAIIVEENQRVLDGLNQQSQLAHDNSPAGRAEQADRLAAEQAVYEKKLGRAKLLLQADAGFGFGEPELALMSAEEIIEASGLDEREKRFGDDPNNVAANLKAMEQSGGLA